WLRSYASSGQFGISCRPINSTTPISASGRKPSRKRSPGPRPAYVRGHERDKSTSTLPEISTLPPARVVPRHRSDVVPWRLFQRVHFLPSAVEDTDPDRHDHKYRTRQDW